MDTPTYQYWTVALWVITLLAGIATITIYGWQLRTMMNSIKAQNLAWLVQHLQAPEIRQARHVVISQLSKKGPFHLWPDDEKKEAATACAAYGTAAVFLRLNRVDRNVLMENWGPSIARVCEICKDLILARRAENGPQYWIALDWLNAEVTKWLEEANKSK